MEWLDSAIFGWSGRPSVSSSVKTADETGSDAEDADYDDVIGILHQHTTSSIANAGSGNLSPSGRTRSYADLHALRAKEADDEGARPRRPRQRSTSVEGSVGVDQLRDAVQTSPNAGFKELTEVVNEELGQEKRE